VPDGLGLIGALNTRYASESSFDQDIYIDTVDNPFTVYFDPNSVLPDGSGTPKSAG